MSTLEQNTEDRLQKICDTLTQQTLEPAKQQAQQLIEEAQQKAQQIIAKAEEQKALLLKEADDELNKEKAIFENSLQQAGKQALEMLRQSIEQQFFNKDFHQMVTQATVDPQLLAEAIRALLKLVESSGWEGSLSAKVGREVDVQKLCSLLGNEVLTKLQSQSLELSNFKGGAQVKVEGKNLTLDLSDEALKELLSGFLRKDFRKFLFHV